MNDASSSSSSSNDSPFAGKKFVFIEEADSPTPKKRDAAQAVLDNYILLAANPSPEQLKRNYVGGSKAKPAAYREPEKWEKNLVSLTKGEMEEMESESAFHRYQKKRGGLQAMDWSTSASTEEKNEEIEKALDGEEARQIKKFANLWKRSSMMTSQSIEEFQKQYKAT